MTAQLYVYLWFEHNSCGALLICFGLLCLAWLRLTDIFRKGRGIRSLIGSICYTKQGPPVTSDERFIRPAAFFLLLIVDSAVLTNVDSLPRLFELFLRESRWKRL